MSDTTIVALVTALLAAIPPTIAALAVYRQTKSNGKNAEIRATAAAEKVEQLVVKTDKIAEGASEQMSSLNKKTDTLTTKAEEIHTLTNSNLTEVKVQLEKAKQEIKELHELILKLSAERGT